MFRACFVSDIHISSPDDTEGLRFLEFLKDLSGKENITHLFLLGDIFDLWVGDHSIFIERYKNIIHEFKRLIDEGAQITYFEGNHDLYLRSFWQEELGINVQEAPQYFVLENFTLRLEHGDQMDPDDQQYLFLRWFLRSYFIRKFFEYLPGWIVDKLGKQSSSKSRIYSTNFRASSKEKIIKKMHEYARKSHELKEFDILIAGHLHIRDDSNLFSRKGKFRSVNLGSWENPCYFEIKNTGGRFIELE